MLAESGNTRTGRHTFLSNAFQTATSPFYKVVKRQASHAASSLLQVETGRGARRVVQRVLEGYRRVVGRRMVGLNPGPEGSRGLLR